MTAQNATSSLLDLVSQNAVSSRLNTIDQAISGSGIGQKNFKGKWEGYTLNNQPTVKVNGRLYNVESVGFTSKSIGSDVTVRAGKGTLTASWR